MEEITITYNHIVQVNLHKGLFFATLEIVNSGVDNVTVKAVGKKNAIKAKKIIDQKLYHVHNKFHDLVEKTDPRVDNFERNLQRLKELVQKNKISEREFNKRKKKLLRKIT